MEYIYLIAWFLCSCIAAFFVIRHSIKEEKKEDEELGKFFDKLIDEYKKKTQNLDG